jgi:DNA-binding GntR family transcriptional regulator
LTIVLDRSSPVPLYFQVAQQLERSIVDGELHAGARLENEVALAERLGVSRPTMRNAIQYLVERGLVVRRRGHGTVVLPPRVRRAAQLTSLYDDLHKSGQRPSTEVRSFEIVGADQAVAGALEVEPDTPVYAIERLRYAGDIPLALMRNHIPADRLPLSEDALRDHGLYELLRSRGVKPQVAYQVIGAKAASTAEARALGESRGAPLLTMQRTASDASGHPIEYGSHVYRASLYSFTLTLSST